MFSLFLIVLFILIFVGAIALQVFLSKKKSKLLGLILPLVFLVFSLITVISFFVPDNEVEIPGITIEYDSNGEIIRRTETNDGVYRQIWYDSDGEITETKINFSSEIIQAEMDFVLGNDEIDESYLTPIESDVTPILTVLLMMLVFLLCNIPTAVLIVIYLVCRKTQKKKSELEKMSVQDL